LAEVTVKAEKELPVGKEDQSGSKQQLAELKNTLYKTELLLQEAKNELIKKTEHLKEKDAQLADIKKSFDEMLKQSGRTSEELTKAKADLDNANAQIEVIGKFINLLNQPSNSRESHRLNIFTPTPKLNLLL